MTETFRSPAEAMHFVKRVVRFISPASVVDAHAFRLIGESPERMEKLLADIRGCGADIIIAADASVPVL